MVAESVQVWIQRAVDAHPDIAQWVQTGVLVFGVHGGRIFEVKARGKKYTNVVKVGCTGVDDRGRLHHVSFDLDVGHGNAEARYPTTEAALLAARAIKVLVGGAAEIRRSKGGQGLNVRVAITPGAVSTNGGKVASRIARYLAQRAGIHVDPTVVVRQVLWIHDEQAAPGGFEVIEACEGTWTPPIEALLERDQLPPNGKVAGGAVGALTDGDYEAEGHKSEDEKPIQKVLSKLKGVRRSGSGYSALCPAHDDANPSLSVTETQAGKVLIKCHGSCTNEAVLAAIGLGPKDLFPKTTKSDSKAGFALEVGTYILSKHFSWGGYCTLKYWRGQFYRYFEGVYSEWPESEMRASITRFMLDEEEHRKYASAGMSTSIMGILQGMCLLDASVRPNSWLGGDPGEKPYWIVMRNGILNTQPFLYSNGHAVLYNHSPLFFALAALPYPYIPQATAPLFKKFLGEMLPDGDIQNLLAEVFGYTLIYCTKFEKFFLYVGQGANGKSVVLTVHRCLLGAENVCAVGLEAFSATRTFPLAAMVGKLANIVEEIGEADRASEGTVKSQVSGAPMTVERKHKDPFIMEPTARHIFSTNTLPRFVDRSDGLWRRLVLIPFGVQLLDESRQDKRLKTAEFWNQSGELPGIFNAALRGLRKLLQDGKFLEPEVCKVAKGEYRLDVNPARQFLLDQFEPAPDSEVWKQEAYRGYKSFCESFGYKPMGANKFASELQITFPGVKASVNAVANGYGGRDRKWIGLRERVGGAGHEQIAVFPQAVQ